MATSRILDANPRLRHSDSVYIERRNGWLPRMKPGRGTAGRSQTVPLATTRPRFVSAIHPVSTPVFNRERAQRLYTRSCTSSSASFFSPIACHMRRRWWTRTSRSVGVARRRLTICLTLLRNNERFGPLLNCGNTYAISGSDRYFVFYSLRFKAKEFRGTGHLVR